MSKKILVFGNTVFSKEILRTLNESNLYELSAWTGKSKDNPVIEYSKQNNIRLYTFDSMKFKTDGLNTLKKINPDLCIVIAYGKIIPQSYLDIPKDGFINIHGSLLPDLRGATPIQAAILNGYTTTGITIQKMVFKMDEGDILKTYKIDIDNHDNFETLRDKMIEQTLPDLINFLNEYFEEKIEAEKQDGSKATYCWIKDFSRENGKINWTNTAEMIHNKIRAFYPEPVSWSLFHSLPGIPDSDLGSFTKPINNKLLNLISSEITENKSNEVPGTMFYADKKLYVSTKDNDLEITKLVLEGKKPMSGTDFGNGIVRKDKYKLL